jgi:hypothetical protein
LKDRWCCHHHPPLGCPLQEPGPPSATNCSAGLANWPTGWAEAKKLWCCRHERKGCVHITFDCNAGRDKWETGWSQEKILQCCGVDHSGCPAGSSTAIPPYDCEAGWGWCTALGR